MATKQDLISSKAARYRKNTTTKPSFRKLNFSQTFKISPSTCSIKEIHFFLGDHPIPLPPLDPTKEQAYGSFKIKGEQILFQLKSKKIGEDFPHIKDTSNPHKMVIVYEDQTKPNDEILLIGCDSHPEREITKKTYKVDNPLTVSRNEIGNQIGIDLVVEMMKLIHVLPIGTGQASLPVAPQEPLMTRLMELLTVEDLHTNIFHEKIHFLKDLRTEIIFHQKTPLPFTRFQAVTREALLVLKSLSFDNQKYLSQDELNFIKTQGKFSIILKLKHFTKFDDKPEFDPEFVPDSDSQTSLDSETYSYPNPTRSHLGLAEPLPSLGSLYRITDSPNSPSPRDSFHHEDSRSSYFQRERKSWSSFSERRHSFQSSTTMEDYFQSIKRQKQEAREERRSFTISENPLIASFGKVKYELRRENPLIKKIERFFDDHYQAALIRFPDFIFRENRELLFSATRIREGELTADHHQLCTYWDLKKVLYCILLSLAYLHEKNRTHGDLNLDDIIFQKSNYNGFLRAKPKDDNTIINIESEKKRDLTQFKEILSHILLPKLPPSPEFKKELKRLHHLLETPSFKTKELLKHNFWNDIPKDLLFIQRALDMPHLTDITEDYLKDGTPVKRELELLLNMGMDQEKWTLSIPTGRDVKNQTSPFSSFEILQVFEIHSPEQNVEQYEAKKREFQEKNNFSFNQTEYPKGAPAEFQSSRLGRDLDLEALSPAVNERLLFAAHPPDLPQLPYSSTRPRFSIRGQLVNGLYFSENGLKADQYAFKSTQFPRKAFNEGDINNNNNNLRANLDKNSEVYYILLYRVALGLSYKCLFPKNDPNFTWEIDRSSKTTPRENNIFFSSQYVAPELFGSHILCDSIIIESEWASPELISEPEFHLRRFREYIVLNKEQTLPLYLIKYRRSTNPPIPPTKKSPKSEEILPISMEMLGSNSIPKISQALSEHPEFQGFQTVSQNAKTILVTCENPHQLKKLIYVLSSMFSTFIQDMKSTTSRLILEIKYPHWAQIISEILIEAKKNNL